MTDFKILSDKEHVLKRSQMYIGSINDEPVDMFVFGKWTNISFVPGLIKIINEIIDNSVDEAIKTNFKYANKISVTMDNYSVSVEDNGRGIPQDEISDLDGKKILRPVAAWTKTKAGSNFNDDDNRKTIGLNGVGSALTNFFSTKFTGLTRDGKCKVIVKCLNNADSVKFEQTKCSQDSGTVVSFLPDFDRFGVSNLDNELQDIIHDRLMSLQIIFPKILFKFNKKRISVKTPKEYFSLYSENIYITKEENTSFAIFNSDGWKQNSFVNGVQTKNGGSHSDYIFNQISEHLIPLIKKSYKVDVPKTIIKVNLGLVLFLQNFNNPKFDSQTKERLTNTIVEIKSHIGINFEKVAKDIIKIPEIINPIVDALVAKKHAADLRAATLEQKKLNKKKISGHIKANDNKDTTLFLTEGDSASGFFINVRDKKRHGLYPLRGKVLNTRDMKPVDVLKNNELNSIMSILGLEYGKRCMFPNYDSIAIMVDADHDGLGSIYPLLLNFFSEWEELFEDGRIKFLKTPVIIAKKGKDVKWFYDINEYKNTKLTGYKIRYIKGLGSLEIDEYKEILHKPQYDVVQLDDKDKLEMLFGKDVSRRKDWMLSDSTSKVV